MWLDLFLNIWLNVKDKMRQTVLLSKKQPVRWGGMWQSGKPGWPCLTWGWLGQDAAPFTQGCEAPLKETRSILHRKSYKWRGWRGIRTCRMSSQNRASYRVGCQFGVNSEVWERGQHIKHTVNSPGQVSILRLEKYDLNILGGTHIPHPHTSPFLHHLRVHYDWLEDFCWKQYYKMESCAFRIRDKTSFEKYLA